jgi:FlaA1/EpsC-like NDP-sugar epimerase
LLITPTLALAFRLDFHDLSGQHTSGLLTFTLLSLVVYLATFFLFGIYRRYWQYASIDDLATAFAQTGKESQ